ncbi:MAG: hypothetical protein R3A51_05560 [Nannocystaceae bacterium]|nr:hypothetical protein [Myxococcales bacterium]
MRSIALLVITITGITAFGCAGNNTIERDGFVLERDKTEEALAKLSRRASFDFGCPAQELQFTILAVHDDMGADMPKQIGVTGCQKRGTYAMEFIPSPAGLLETGWALDAAGVQEM